MNIVENEIKFTDEYILIEKTLIKINQICLIRPNQNRYIGGTEILISSGNILTFEKISINRFNKYDYNIIGFIHIEKYIINENKVIAISPIPEHYGFDGTHVYFEGAGKIDIANIDASTIIENIIDKF